MNARIPLSQFMAAADQQVGQRHRDQLDPFREFGAEIDRDRDMRRAGQGPSPYFQQPAFAFLKERA